VPIHRIKKSNLIKILPIICILALPFVQSETDQAAYASASSTQGTVFVANLNVRDAADSASKIIGLAHKGDTFEIIQTRNGWDQIKLANNQTGWVNDSYIGTEEAKATVKAAVLNVREGSGLTSRVIGQLKAGETITVHKEQDGWAEIVSSSGFIGWVYKYYITKDEVSQQQSQSITQAQSQQQTQSTTKTQESAKPEQHNQLPLTGKTIVLDPGHGGKDNGTTSFVGTHEKTLNLETAQVIEQKLENAGANVIMTRTNDTFIPLQQRAEISNKNHADAFISIHYNWSNDPSVNGLTDFYYQKAKDNELASDVLTEVVKATKLKNIGTRYDDLSVLRNNLQPSILIELGFLSSKQDDPVVENAVYREKVAQGVYLGLLDYFSK